MCLLSFSQQFTFWVCTNISTLLCSSLGLPAGFVARLEAEQAPGVQERGWEEGAAAQLSPRFSPSNKTRASPGCACRDCNDAPAGERVSSAWPRPMCPAALAGGPQHQCQHPLPCVA